MDEQIVFVNEDGSPTGITGPKLASHHANTALHLAFSCYLFNDVGQLLLTQRAHSKKVWPGVWTNSFCGHPLPEETMENAVRRRAAFELGVTIDSVKCVVVNYRYQTPPFNGIIENEFCPIYTAHLTSTVEPNPNEVAAFEWMDLKHYALSLKDSPELYSYWCKDQLSYLITSGSKYFVGL